MKRKILILLALLAPLGAFAIFAATDTFDVDATIRAPISITNIQILNFGTIDKPSSGSVPITITAATGTQSGANFSGGLAAEFTLTGEAAASVNISISSATNVLTHVGNGTDTIVLSLFTNATTPAGDAFDGSGNLTVHVGGTVTVASGDTVGLYRNNTDVILSVVY